MKIKMGLLLLAGGLVALAAWLVHVPEPIQAVEVPEKYRDTVAKGLDFLAKNQAKDGHWEGDDGKHPVAMTGLVGLALLMERHAEGESKFENQINKAADWLMQQSDAKRDGLIFSGHPSETSRYMEGHGLATMFLASVYHIGRAGDARGKKLGDVLTRAIKYSAKAQSTQGGWYHTSRVEGHDFDALLPTVIQIQALQSAKSIALPEDMEGRAQAYLAKFYKTDNKEAAKPPRVADMIPALACRFRTIREYRQNEAQMLKMAIGACKKDFPLDRRIEFGADELTHYYYAQVMFIAGGMDWIEYSGAVFEQLRAAQHKDGSWRSSKGIGVGRVYATSLWCTILLLQGERYPTTKQLQQRIF